MGIDEVLEMPYQRFIVFLEHKNTRIEEENRELERMRKKAKKR